MIAQITELVPLINRAEEASNRWLFLACLAILMIGGVAAIRWLIKSMERKDALFGEERKELHIEIKNERSECRVARKEDQVQFLAALALKDAALVAHTKAIEALTAVVTKHDTDMRSAHEIELKSIIRSEIEKRSAQP